MRCDFGLNIPMYGLESGPGVAIVRREFLRLSIGALGILLARSDSQRPPSTAPITWDEFLSDLTVRAQKLLQKHLDEDVYVGHVAQQLRRVEPRLIPHGRALVQEKLFAVTEFLLSGGHGFQHHDHRDYNGVILVLEGRVHIRNFDLVNQEGVAPTDRRVLIRQTLDSTYGPRDISSLTTTRDNIHHIEADRDGCRLLDIFTWVGPQPRSVYLDVDQQPVDDQRRIFRATFIS